MLRLGYLILLILIFRRNNKSHPRHTSWCAVNNNCKNTARNSKCIYRFPRVTIHVERIMQIIHICCASSSTTYVGDVRLLPRHGCLLNLQARLNPQLLNWELTSTNWNNHLSTMTILYFVNFLHRHFYSSRHYYTKTIFGLDNSRQIL